MHACYADGESANNACCTPAPNIRCGIVHPGKASTHEQTRPGKEPPYETTCHGKEPPTRTTDLLAAPTHGTGEPVTGATKDWLHLQNKCARKDKQAQQHTRSYWQQHKGHMVLPPAQPHPTSYCNEMAPANLALYHPAADLLLEYPTKRCPMHTGKHWSFTEMEAAIARGPHPSALHPGTLKQL